MTVGCMAAVAFYLGTFFTTVYDIYVYNLSFAPNETIGGVFMNVSYTCGELSLINPGGNPYD